MNKKLLDTIAILRFPCTCMVVFIHSHFSKFVNGSVISLSEFPLYSNLSYLISEVLCRIAVPFFFVSSGYLFFFKPEVFNFATYKNKIKKRIYTLLIPYLFWNGITLLLLVINNVFFKSNNLIADLDFINCIEVFWDRGDGMPICYPLWYVRDLMVMVSLSPLIYYFLQKLNIWIVCVAAVFWLFSKDNISGIINPSGIFFFCLGAYISIFNYPILDRIRRINKINTLISILSLLVVLIHFNLSERAHLPYLLVRVIYHICIFSFLCSMVNMTSVGLESGKFHINTFLIESCFFIYAYHAYPIGIILMLFLQIFSLSDGMLLVVYFISPIIVILMGLVIYKTLKKVFPFGARLIIGQRVG